MPIYLTTFFALILNMLKLVHKVFVENRGKTGKLFLEQSDTTEPAIQLRSENTLYTDETLCSYAAQTIVSNSGGMTKWQLSNILPNVSCKSYLISISNFLRFRQSLMCLSLNFHVMWYFSWALPFLLGRTDCFKNQNHICLPLTYLIIVKLKMIYDSYM